MKNLSKIIKVNFLIITLIHILIEKLSLVFQSLKVGENEEIIANCPEKKSAAAADSEERKEKQRRALPDIERFEKQHSLCTAFYLMVGNYYFFI